MPVNFEIKKQIFFQIHCVYMTNQYGRAFMYGKTGFSSFDTFDQYLCIFILTISDFTESSNEIISVRR